jgi:hypothetical protein
MGIKAGLQFLGKAVANYADDAARLAAQSGDDVANYAKACGKRSILETKPSIFHGINPTISYPPSGKVYELPRFCTQEMQQARKLNQIALRQIKHPVNPNFPKATAEDLRRLTSETVEDSFSRVQWTNPKDGKVYHLLKQGETADGKVIVRILGEDGSFIKEASVVPKKIGIIDSLGCLKNNSEISLSDALYLEHGDFVTTFAKRNNPFATYILKNNSSLRGRFTDWSLNSCADEIVGEKLDYLSISLGSECKTDKVASLTKNVTHFDETLAKKSKDTRVLVAAGNGGKNSTALELRGQIEGVGSLSTKGKISESSASRSSRLTQHYELGEYSTKGVYNPDGQLIGLNFTGLPGCDVKIKYRELKDLEIQKIKKLKSELETLAKKKKELKSLSDEWKQCIADEVTVERELKKLAEGTIYEKIPARIFSEQSGTSFSTPVRAAKLALNDMMEGIL